MKKIINSLLLLVVLSACNSTENAATFDSQKLQGKYVVDISPFIKKSLDKEENEGLRLVAGLMMSSIELDIYFYENNEGLAILDGYALKLLKSLSDEPIETQFKFEYKIEDGSVLFVKKKGESEYKDAGKINAIGGHYDHIEITFIDEDDSEEMTLNLKKVKES